MSGTIKIVMNTRKEVKNKSMTKASTHYLRAGNGRARIHISQLDIVNVRRLHVVRRHRHSRAIGRRSRRRSDNAAARVRDTGDSDAKGRGRGNVSISSSASGSASQSESGSERRRRRRLEPSLLDCLEIVEHLHQLSDAVRGARRKGKTRHDGRHVQPVLEHIVVLRCANESARATVFGLGRSMRRKSGGFVRCSKRNGLHVDRRHIY